MHLERLVKQLGLSRYVRLLDFQPRFDHVLAGVDALVHTADREPFGRVLIEAMQAGVPVIAARAAGPAEIIEPNRSGLLFEPDNKRELIEYMTRVFRDPLLRSQLVEAGCERVKNKYTSARTTQSIEKLYDQVADGTNAAVRAMDRIGMASDS